MNVSLIKDVLLEFFSPSLFETVDQTEKDAPDQYWDLCVGNPFF